MSRPVAYLAVLQFHLDSIPPLGLHIAPPDAPTHLVCGGDHEVWGATLCGLPFDRPADAPSTIGAGITKPGHPTTPCWSCVATGRLFDGIPVFGDEDLARPVADALRVEVLGGCGCSPGEGST